MSEITNEETPIVEMTPMEEIRDRLNYLNIQDSPGVPRELLTAIGLLTSEVERWMGITVGAPPPRDLRVSFWVTPATHEEVVKDVKRLEAELAEAKGGPNWMERDNLQAKLSSAMAELSKLREENRALVVEVDRLREAGSRLKEDRLKFLQEASRLRKQGKDNFEYTRELESRCATQGQELLDLKHDLPVMHRKLKEAEAYIKDLEDEGADRQAEIERLGAPLHYALEIQQLEKCLAEAEAKTEEVRSAYNRVFWTHQREFDAYKEKLAVLQQTLDETGFTRPSEEEDE